MLILLLIMKTEINVQGMHCKACEEVCKYAIENFEDEVTPEIVKKIL